MENKHIQSVILQWFYRTRPHFHVLSEEIAHPDLILLFILSAVQLKPGPFKPLNKYTSTIVVSVILKNYSILSLNCKIVLFSAYSYNQQDVQIIFVSCVFQYLNYRTLSLTLYTFTFYRLLLNSSYFRHILVDSINKVCISSLFVLFFPFLSTLTAGLLSQFSTYLSSVFFLYRISLNPYKNF